MSDPVVCEDVARADFDRMCEARYIDLGKDGEYLTLLGRAARESVVASIMKGWITVGEGSSVSFTPQYSGKSFKDGVAPTLTFGDMDGAALLDTGSSEGIARDFGLAACMSKQPMATLRKLHRRDCDVLIALITIFLV